MLEMLWNGVAERIKAVRAGEVSADPVVSSARTVERFPGRYVLEANHLHRLVGRLPCRSISHTRAEAGGYERSSRCV